MPNDCENHLELEHFDQSKLKEALAAHERGELLAYFLPEPAYSGPDEWYSWRKSNWGTKWDAYGDTTIVRRSRLKLSVCRSHGSARTPRTIRRGDRLKAEKSALSPLPRSEFKNCCCAITEKANTAVKN
jgi:hypothetical protein